MLNIEIKNLFEEKRATAFATFEAVALQHSRVENLISEATRYFIDAPLTALDWAVAALEATYRHGRKDKFTVEELLNDKYNPALHPGIENEITRIMETFAEDPKAVVDSYQQAGHVINDKKINAAVVMHPRFHPLFKLVDDYETLGDGVIMNARRASAELEEREIDGLIRMDGRMAGVVADLAIKEKPTPREQTYLDDAKYQRSCVAALRPILDRRLEYLATFSAATAPRSAA